MELEEILKQIFTFAGSFNIQLVLWLILICTIGEVAVLSIPYFLESIWLLFGYNLGIGTLTPLQLLLLWLAALTGRVIGAAVLYFIGQLGSIPIKKLYQRYIESHTLKKFSGSNASRILGKINYLSPFYVASGRLLGLRIPLTLALGANRKFRALFLGVTFSSLVWDGIYISAGLAGGKTALEPVQMMLYSLIGLTSLYILTFAAKQLWRVISRKKTEQTDNKS